MHIEAVQVKVLSSILLSPFAQERIWKLIPGSPYHLREDNDSEMITSAPGYIFTLTDNSPHT